MGLLVSIDNGGTLTDVCATDGATVVHAKTITTPHDLTECFVKSLEALSVQLYGGSDLRRLIAEIDYIRYSTTQGTNALVQRKGPRIGWLGNAPAALAPVQAAAPELFADLVGECVQTVAPDAAQLDRLALVNAASRLVSAGANRIVVGFSGTDAARLEKAAKRLLYRSFPRHLLGAVPLLFSTELCPSGAEEQRIWATFINAFLHPAMDQFLYNAENKLRAQRARKPLLIFRNDGNSTRVAKTVAIKTYSSGPQGGVVGAQVLLEHYGCAAAASIDIGGTTTDIAVFEQGRVQVDQTGLIEGVRVPIALSDLHSIGVGGGSVIRVENGRLQVGPQSVGSLPGPACFARGGTAATITDAFLVEGILDPASYFGGQLPLDRERAENAIRTHVAAPLRADLQHAVDAMVDAYDGKIAQALREKHGGGAERMLLAFGGAGPMSACGIAEKAGIRKILVPRYAAVFCAYGIGFSDICHDHSCRLIGGDDAELAQAKAALTEQGRRGMLAEGFELDGCRLEFSLLAGGAAPLRCEPERVPAAGRAGAVLELKVTRPIDKIRLAGTGVQERRKAAAAGVRDGRRRLPLFKLEELAAGDWNEGPCLVEEAFFTCVVKPGWRFVLSGCGDLLVQR